MTPRVWMPLIALLVACPPIEEKPEDDGEETGEPCEAVAWYTDADADGYGSAEVEACERPEGAVPDAGDCDDADPEIHPGAVERCNALDDTCEGEVDEGLVLSDFYGDADGDGFHGGEAVQACVAPEGTSAEALDCDDDDDTIHPDAAETCDEIDNDCDTLVDDDDPDSAGIFTFYLDLDHDGYGQDAATITSCAPVEGYTIIGGDCDDTDPDVLPGSQDECDGGTDDDCDGEIDEDGPFDLFYADDDGDGFGDAAEPTEACDAPPGFVSNARDCDDTDPDIAPGADERCNLADDDCDGRTDEGDVCDTGVPPDTGLASIHWIGEGETSAGSWVAGTFGAAWYGIDSGAEICSLVGEWYESAAPPRRLCPACDWAFQLDTRGTTASSADCSDFGVSDGDLDGLEYVWGFATSTTLYGYAMENVIYLYYSRSWYPWVYNIPASGLYQVDGDMYAFSLDKNTYSYYYYYP